MEAVLGAAGQLGPTGLLAVAVLAILTGRLIPLSSHLRAIEDKAKEAETWRQAYYAQRDINHALIDPITRLADGQKTTLGLLNALPVPGDRESP